MYFKVKYIDWKKFMEIFELMKIDAQTSNRGSKRIQLQNFYRYM